jgi:hypothetical protein
MNFIERMDSFELTKRSPKRPTVYADELPNSVTLMDHLGAYDLGRPRLDCLRGSV